MSKNLGTRVPRRRRGDRDADDDAGARVTRSAPVAGTRVDARGTHARARGAAKLKDTMTIP